ncbi:FAD-binding protein [Streptomyces sp. NPDC089424]|uniref:FAD-binding protein n=1 Tax=Streptomyces sp. NPDC089424 TaxID=3365917 RepID=UPI00380FBF7B
MDPAAEPHDHRHPDQQDTAQRAHPETSARPPSWTGEVDRLAGSVDGPVLTPGSAAYDEEVSGFNRSVTHRPAVVVGATSEADVTRAMRFAQAHGLAVAVLSTGHGPSVGAAGETLLITTHRMTGVTVDAGRATARVEAGVRFGRLVAAAAAHGLAPLAGSSPGVGVVGYTLAGGASPIMGRKYGWACDHVSAMDVVTADGTAHHVSPDDEADLFGALLGGKSNFGVVTAMEFRLFPVTHLYAGALFFSGDHAREVLEAYGRFAAAAPDETTSGIAFLDLPPLPGLPPFLQGGLVVSVRVSHLGPPSEGERLVAPLRRAAPVLMDTVHEMPVTDFAALTMDPSEPAAAVEHFGLLRELSRKTIDAVLDTVGPSADSSVNLFDLRALGGAFGNSPATPNAVGGRDAAYAFFALTIVPPGHDVAAYADSGRELVERLRPWLGPGKHPNFLAPADSTLQATREAYDPEVYARLRALKTVYDPENRLRVNHNIPPLRAA